ncbi:MAG: radical SAM protein [Steroidobacteraceae bacterium]
MGIEADAEPAPAPQIDRQIDRLSAPLLVSWQLTRDCDLACLHCCTASAPGKRLADELCADEAMALAQALLGAQVPYVMLCGGEPLLVPHWLELAERLGTGGVQLKIETNGQRLDPGHLERLARLPIRSIQVSLDADTQDTYARQRPGGSLERAHAACRWVRAAGLPLEITFAPTRLNIHEAEAVIDRAAALGAFRFNTGSLMRIGTAARLWRRLEPSAEQYREFRALLERKAASQHAVGLELCYTPFSMTEALLESLREPPATLLILPQGWVKVAGPLPHICADLRRHTLPQAWDRYRSAWRDRQVRGAARRAAELEALQESANDWMPLSTLG